MLAGGVNVGALLVTVTWKSPEALACIESVTVQWTVVVPIGNVVPDGGTHTAAIVPSSMSLPFAVNVTTAPDAPVAGLVTLAGGVNVGALLVTVTWKLPATLAAFESVTLQLTSVVPITNVDPDAGEQTAGIEPSSMSLPTALNVTAAPAALVAGVVMSAGGVNVGGLFVTVTVKSPEAVACIESVTVQWTVVVPIGNVVPDGGTHTAAMVPSSMSLPFAVNVTTAPAALVAPFVMLAGGVNVGALLVTITVKDPVAVRPPESVTEQFTVVVPIANTEFDDGVHVGVRELSCASEAVTVKLTCAPSGPVAAAVRFGDTVSVGGVLQNASFAAWMVIVGNTALDCA